MLESMIYNPRPTRAEISDVANAVYDGTSAIMLSGESAAGKYPVNAVKVMSEIAEETERHINYTKRFLKSDFKIKNQVDALSHATCSVAIDINAKAIAVYSASGKTVRMISRFRVPVDIMGITSNKKAWYKLALSWGVIPVYIKDFVKEECLPQYTKTLAKEILRLKEGDSIVITTGSGNNYTGNTDTIKLENI
jgi:pyruvate kinase